MLLGMDGREEPRYDARSERLLRCFPGTELGVVPLPPSNRVGRSFRRRRAATTVAANVVVASEDGTLFLTYL